MFRYKDSIVFILFCSILFSITLGYKYSKFLDFKKAPLYACECYVGAVYDNNTTFKLIHKDFTLYTNIKNASFQHLDTIEISILTQKITFIQYLKGFWAETIMPYNKHSKHDELLYSLTQAVNAMHQNRDIASFFNGLFFGTNLTKSLQTQSINLGVLHLIALSGYHLSVIATIIYFSFGFVYKYFHNKFFPYRNYKFDILLFTSLVLMAYVELAGFIPSLVRSFAMYLFAIFLMRNNIKILSFLTLAMVVLFLIALFPELLFSIGFWFSAFGIFYIYLYLHYFSKLQIIISFIFFNIWLFLAMNPIVHYFFDMTSMWQLASPIFSMLFVLFFPLEILLHTLGIGGALDSFIAIVLQIPTIQYPKSTSVELFIICIVMSLGSIFSKTLFITFNTFLVLYNLWLFI